MARDEYDISDGSYISASVQETGKIETHPLANLIRSMTPEEYAALVEDIGANGLQQPIALYDGKILDGRHRWQAVCDLAERGINIPLRFYNYLGTEEQAKVFVYSLNVHRRHLEYDQRVGLAVLRKQEIQAAGLVKPGPKPIVGNIAHNSMPARETAAAEMKVSPRALSDGERVQQEAPDLFEQLLDGGIKLRPAVRECDDRKRESEQTARIQAITEHIPVISDRWRVGVGDISVFNSEDPSGTGKAAEDDLLSSLGIAPGSVDVLITDPPYPGEFVPLFANLSRFALEVLKPGGLLICMSGQTYLPDVMQHLCRHLSYQWTCAYLTPGGQATQIFPRKVNTFWKPLLIFSKGKYEGAWYGDVTRSDVNDNDKRFHEWGQSESGMADIITRFSRPGDLICDPFLGAGTTGVAAIAADRRFVGFDIDPARVDVSKVRLTDASR